MPPSSHHTNQRAKPAASTAHEPAKISRRQFGRDAAIATAASWGTSALLTAGTVAAAPAAQVTPEPAVSSSQDEQDKKGDPLKGLSPQQVADVEAKHANILRKHGDRFSDAQKKRLRRILAQHERLLAPVRAFAVQNGDPPASVLRVSFDRLGLTTKEGGKD